VRAARDALLYYSTVRSVPEHKYLNLKSTIMSRLHRLIRLSQLSKLRALCVYLSLKTSCRWPTKIQANQPELNNRSILQGLASIGRHLMHEHLRRRPVLYRRMLAPDEICNVHCKLLITGCSLGWICQISAGHPYSNIAMRTRVTT